MKRKSERASKNDRQINIEASMPNKWNKFNANGNERVERNKSSFDDGFLLYYMTYSYHTIYVSHPQPHHLHLHLHLHLKMHSSSVRTKKTKTKRFHSM